MAWPSGYPKTLTPQQRVDRARNAANFRASVDGLIKALAAKEDELTPAQRQRLVDLAVGKSERVAS